MSGFSISAGHSHHGINLVKKIQRDLLILLQELKTNGYLSNTLLIVMGDHGLRYGRVRELVQGKLEERLPLLAMAFPPGFKARYPKLAANLRTNTERLTSWFDLYATFRHMLSYPDLPTDLKHGQSLLTEMPASRTCKDAAVTDHWCPCLQWSAVNAKHSHAQNAALATIEYINNLNGEHETSQKSCAKLTLKKINYVLLERPNEQVLRFSHVDFHWKTQFRKNYDIPQDHFCHYQVQFVTSPNDGVYEATVKFVKQNFVVNTAISRVNKYGDQPQCIANQYPHLRKFCLCQNVTNS